MLFLVFIMVGCLQSHNMWCSVAILSQCWHHLNAGCSVGVLSCTFHSPALRLFISCMSLVYQVLLWSLLGLVGFGAAVCMSGWVAFCLRFGKTRYPNCVVFKFSVFVRCVLLCIVWYV